MNNLKDWIGKPGLKTKDSMDVIILGKNPYIEDTFVGCIKDCAFLAGMWKGDGSFFEGSYCDEDIIFPTPKVKTITIWKNVYKEETRSPQYYMGMQEYETKEEAEENKMTYRGYKKTIPITFEVNDD